MSIEHFFLTRVGLNWETRAPLLLRYNDDPARGPERLAHLYASEYVRFGYVDAATFNSYFKFSFVRNPWARLVSEYRWGNHKYRYTFKEFVTRGLTVPSMRDEYRHIAPQYDFLYDEWGNQLVDFVGRFERLQQDFSVVCEKLNIEESTLPYVNASMTKRIAGLRNRVRGVIADLRQPKYQDYREYYDKDLRDVVGRVYAKDVATFGYSFADAA